MRGIEEKTLDSTYASNSPLVNICIATFCLFLSLSTKTRQQHVECINTSKICDNISSVEPSSPLKLPTVLLLHSRSSLSLPVSKTISQNISSTYRLTANNTYIGFDEFQYMSGRRALSTTAGVCLEAQFRIRNHIASKLDE